MTGAPKQVIDLYNKQYTDDLGNHAMLEGVAQIITEDISLFNRMMNPLRSLRRNR
jgi:hypothetical protein